MPNARTSAAPAHALGVLPEEGTLRAGAWRIVEAATVAFAERGYHGVSVRDIASVVGIKAASFYAHFPSKEALLAEIAVVGHSAHLVHSRDAILSAGSDPVDQLQAGVRASVQFQATYPLLTLVANNELHALSKESRDRITTMRHDFGVLLAAVIDRGNAMGVFACEDTWLALYAIGGMGIRVASWFRPPGLRDADSPLTSYPEEASTWLPENSYDVDAVADAYAEFALRVVGAQR